MKLTFEKCLEEAEKYETRFEFQKKSNNAYKKCLRKGWLDFVCSHMKVIRQKLTKEKCKEIALKYKWKKDFRENEISVYQKCIKMGWLLEVSKYLKSSKKKNGYWSFERCLEEAKKWNTKKDFKNGSPSAYKSCLKNNWLKNVCSDMVDVGNKYKRVIYLYVFSDFSVYIGLTYNLNERNKQHLNSNTSVSKYIKKKNFYPKLYKITNYLDIKKAQNYEKILIKNFKIMGFNVLNKRKGGESGTNNLYWTFERCLEESKKWKWRNDFRKNCNGAYESSRKRGWLDLFFPKRKPRTKN